MSLPANYNRVADFTTDQANNIGGRATVSTAELDAELDAARTSINALVAAIALVLRADNKLLDNVVWPGAISTEALAYLKTMIGGAAWLNRGMWNAISNYYANDIVTDGGSTYLCLVAHNSAAITTANAAYWRAIAQKGDAGPASGLPSMVGNSIKVLRVNVAESSQEWSAVTASMVSADVALVANETFTGTTTFDQIVATGAETHGGPVALNGDVTVGADASITMTPSTETFAATQTLDLAKSNIKSLTVTANFTAVSGLVTANRVAGKQALVRLTATGGPWAFPTTGNGFMQWKFKGTRPTQIAAGKTGELTLTCYGPNETDIVAGWGVES